MLRPGIRRLLGLDVARKDIIVRDLEDELQLHLELRAQQLEKRGLSPEAAMAEARQRYGRVQDATQEIHRHAKRREQYMQWHITFDSFAQDVRFAFRSLRRAVKQLGCVMPETFASMTRPTRSATASE